MKTRKGTRPQVVASKATSSRHTELLGNFGEWLTTNFLSRVGWEVIHADHTGLDLIASRGKKRIGVTVKSRFHEQDNMKGAAVHLFDNDGHGGSKARNALDKACRAFDVEPWVGVYKETATKGILVLMPLKVYDDPKNQYNSRPKRAPEDFKTSEKFLAKYREDPHVSILELDFSQTHGKTLAKLTEI